jgi:2-keto-4-pentenoate hydratase/2-oxohepta-3-ene-1,7-dioic acid hydratase in catechol pathway
MGLSFTVPGAGSVEVEVRHLLNGGYAGRHQEHVKAHIDELAALGIPGPTVVPTMYPVSTYLAQQTGAVPVQHGRTSGEVEWAIIVDNGGDVLLTLACDHTDRELEVHGIAWSKNASPDVLASEAWRLAEVEDHLDSLTLTAWVTNDGHEQQIQSATLGDLLPPSYWVEVLRQRGLLEPGTVLLSGTVNMAEGVNQFADGWRAELGDPVLGRRIGLAYEVVPMAEPIG